MVSDTDLSFPIFTKTILNNTTCSGGFSRNNMDVGRNIVGDFGWIFAVEFRGEIL